MKQYQYGVFATGEDTPRLQTSVYQEARDFADGWNRASFTNKRAEVKVRTVEISPWTLHHHEKMLAKRAFEAQARQVARMLNEEL